MHCIACWDMDVIFINTLVALYHHYTAHNASSGGAHVVTARHAHIRAVTSSLT